VGVGCFREMSYGDERRFDREIEKVAVEGLGIAICGPGAGACRAGARRGRRIRFRAHTDLSCAYAREARKEIEEIGLRAVLRRAIVAQAGEASIRARRPGGR